MALNLSDLPNLQNAGFAVIYSLPTEIGVAAIAVTGGLSLVAVLLWLTTIQRHIGAYKHTHIYAYYASLIFANTLQAIGTLMDFNWVGLAYVVSGDYCHAQGLIKQAGNVGAAVWSFMIALHLFNLLFLRWESTVIGLIATLIGGWSAVGAIVTSGEIIQDSRGPYYNVVGYWCDISNEYPIQQFFLEFFIEFLSAAVGFLLYLAVLLRVRGNLVMQDNKWHLRFLAGGENWKLQIGRDMIDTKMLKVAAHMVWFPVAYSVTIIPISIVQVVDIAGHQVPSWAYIVTEIIYAISGIINILLLIATRRLLPDTNSMPIFSTPRKDINSTSTESLGYTPFILPTKDQYPYDTEKGRDRWSGSDYSVVDFELPPDTAIAYPQPTYPTPNHHRRQFSDDSQSSTSTDDSKSRYPLSEYHAEPKYRDSAKHPPSQHYPSGGRKKSRWSESQDSSRDSGHEWVFPLSQYYASADSGRDVDLAPSLPPIPDHGHMHTKAKASVSSSSSSSRGVDYLGNSSTQASTSSSNASYSRYLPRDSHARDSQASLSSEQSDEIRDFWEEFISSGSEGRGSTFTK